MLACAGRVQREGQIVHIVVKELYDLTHWMSRIGDADMEHTGANANIAVVDQAPPRLRQRTRDFH